MNKRLLVSAFIGIATILSCSRDTPEPTQLGPFQLTNLDIDDASAHWVSSGRLIWKNIEDASRFELRAFGFDAGESVVFELTPGAELTDKLNDQFRHLSSRPVFEVSGTELDFREAVKGQILAIAYNSSGDELAVSAVQMHGLLDDLYYYPGKLGPQIESDGIRVDLWAPTAKWVELLIYDKNKNLREIVSSSGDPNRDGVWRFEGSSSWNNMYYRFNITVYHPENQQVNTYEVTDPYSVSLSVDSEYSQFADLSGDESLKPEGWDDFKKPLPNAADITLYEAHIHDFSYFDETVPQDERGTYMAFTHNGTGGREVSNGMKHLSRLADAGLTHLHLMPVNDIASIPEKKSDIVELYDSFDKLCEHVDPGYMDDMCERYSGRIILDVFKELAAENPITKDIQRTYHAKDVSTRFAQVDGFNWGYDPFHFNTPEGSYSTEPDGNRRILEFRQMVQALYNIGLHVVIDVVYNHTHATGLNRFSVLDKVVPWYYHRLNTETGKVETSTCCPNTAAEFKMMEKLIIDSVVFWAKEYKIDSFRFDLMGHHPRYVMENLLDTLAQYNLADDGFDGENIYIYGEGWNFGEVADNRIFDQATQFMMGGTGIGNFNDRSRDGIRGAFYSWSGREQGFANGRYLFPNSDESASRDEQRAGLLYDGDRIRVGMAGNLSSYPYTNRNGERTTGGNEWIGFTEKPQETVNYIDKHDNETLWDNTQAKLPAELDMDQRLRIHLLSQAFINFGQGVPFHQLGTDMLRSKSMDRNSYDSGDWFNRVDYTFETHNWGIGLPPGWDNEDRWDEMSEFLTNPEIRVDKVHIAHAHELFLEQLRIRYSTPLFRLDSADEINRRVAYHNTGSGQIPGLIVMSISDGQCAGEQLDTALDGIVVAFNADLDPVTFQLPVSGLVLHKNQSDGVDMIVREANTEDGLILVPGLTAAVFVKPAIAETQGEFVCNK